jgi:hypothetical protein
MFREVIGYVLADIDFEWFAHDLIDLLDEQIDFRYKLNQALGYQYHSVVLAPLSSLAYDISQLLRNLGKSHLVFFDLLAY